jgi:N6-L-threonylcarbamoyladenine synthase
MLRTLAIETSCDDTSLAIVGYDNGNFTVEHIQAYSQIAHHQVYGGVVPEIAFRLHSEQILALVKQFTPESLHAVDSISVTTHPGLPWSLLVGKTVAQMLAHHYQKPLRHVHHIQGHLFSLLLERNEAELQFPWIVLTVSGGHNEIYHIERKPSETDLSWKSINWCVKDTWSELTHEEVGLGVGLNEKATGLTLTDLTITKLWKTLDDAAGECFDKVARMLGGPYPGGQWISEQAAKGHANPEYRFKRITLGMKTGEWTAWDEGKYDFSFSGMKAHAYTLLRRICAQQWLVEGIEGISKLDQQIIADVAYEFQEAVCETLAMKLITAVQEFSPASVGIVGGVSANDRLLEVAQSMMTGAGLSQKVLRPAKKVYSTDNGAMIGVVGLMS